MGKSLFSEDGRGLARLLAATRASAGCTQTELARRIGRPQPVISLIEQGERRVDVVEFRRIAEALGMDPVALFARYVDTRGDADPPIK